MSIYLATKSFKFIIDWRLEKIENIGQRIGREIGIRENKRKWWMWIISYIPLQGNIIDHEERCWRKREKDKKEKVGK